MMTKTSRTMMATNQAKTTAMRKSSQRPIDVQQQAPDRRGGRGAWSARNCPHRVLALLFALGVSCAMAMAPDEAFRLLRKADSLKTADHAEFAAIVQLLEQQSATLPLPQQHYLRYLQGWKNAYDGQYETAIPALKAIVAESADATLRFRATATLVNVLAIATRH